VSSSSRWTLIFSPVPSSSQPASLAAPPLPQRKDSSAQADDIEDVKKVRCAGEFMLIQSYVQWDSPGR
jgi:hypothetical protein